MLTLGLGVAADGQSRSTKGSTFGTAAKATSDIIRDGVLPQFGDYELLEEIARGGMGVVYRARQKSLHRLVAVKLILAGQLATPESVQRFRLEAEAAARLHHPGIVPIYEIGEFETQHFYSMKLIDGVSLSECRDEFIVNSTAAASERWQQQLCVAELISKVARALDFAHHRGVLHRDLKPSNILIDEDGIPYLTDFGLAKLTGNETGGLTLTHAVLGTPGYVAPEQAIGKTEITTAADVYGLGATLYELLTGQPPFIGSSAVETMWMAIHNDPVPPRKISPGLDRDIETIAMHCLEKQPDQRYWTAAAVAEDLERFVRREPIRARPVSTPEYIWRWCQRNPGISTLVSFLMLTFFIGSGLVFWQWMRAERANSELQANSEKILKGSIELSITNEHLHWNSINDMINAGQSSRALAKVAWLIRKNQSDWKAANFGISLIEQRRFPIPLAPAIRHPEGNELTVARLSPDGQRIVTASFDGTARVWDAHTSLQVAPALEHAATVTWAEFSPNSTRIATSSEDKTVRLWNAETGEPLSEPLVHEAAVVRVHYSCDGRFLLSRTQNAVTLFDAEGKKQLGPLDYEGNIVQSKFTSDGKALFLGIQAGNQSRVEAWDVETKQQLFEIPTGSFLDADINPDMTRIITLDREAATVWNVPDRSQLLQVGDPDSNLEHVKFSPVGDTFATSDYNQFVQVWNTESGLPATQKLPHHYFVTGFSFIGLDNRLATWSDDSFVRIWDTKSSQLDSEPIKHTHRVQYVDVGFIEGQEVLLSTVSHLKSRSAETQTGAAQLWRHHQIKKPARRSIGIDRNGLDGQQMSHNGRWLAFGMTTGQVCVMETATGKLVCDPISIHGGAWGMEFTIDDSQLIITTSTGQISSWSLPGAELVGQPVELKTTIQPMELSTDGQFFATGSTDGFLRLWSTESLQIIRTHDQGSEINSVAFSPDGKLVASAGENRIVHIWNVTTGQLQCNLVGHTNEVLRVVFAPDSRHLVTASHDHTARLWNIEGEQLHVLQHQGEVVDVVFNPTGTLVATGARDRTALLWDTHSGQPKVRSLLHDQAVRSVRFSPDGQRLLTLDFYGARLWDVSTGHPLTVRLPNPILTGIGFQSSSSGPQFTPDGRSFYIAVGATEARLWESQLPPSPIPNWFPDFLEGIARQQFNGDEEIPATVSNDTFLSLKARLLKASEQDYYTQWARTWLEGN